jgi:hypothetical protein
MESADGRVELLVDLRRGDEDVLYARVRAADNHRQAFRASDSGLLGPGGQDEEPGQDFRGSSHNLEVGLRPGCTAAQDVGILTIEVTHLWRQRLARARNSFGAPPLKNAGSCGT